MFELVIFDCDGVLVDSERITNTVFAEMLNELGLSLSLDDMFEHFVGNSMARCLKVAEDMLGRPVPEGFENAYRVRIQAALAQGLRPMRGIEQALDELDELDIPFCVASSGDHYKMRTTLGLTGLLPRFEAKLFSVTEVPRAKPAPDVFLFAAERMGATPARTAVVEDTPIGVQAGVAAGMTVFGYAELVDGQRLLTAGARSIFTDMSQLSALLRST